MPVLSFSDESDMKSMMNVNATSQNINLKVPDVPTFWLILSDNSYVSAVHWVRVDNMVRSVVCAGDVVKDNGFSPDNCPVCKKVIDLYQKSKNSASKGDKNSAKNFKEQANSLRAKIENKVIAAQGSNMIERNPGHRSVKRVPVFLPSQMLDDKEEACKYGILTLGSHHWRDLISFIGSENLPKLTCLADFPKHVLRSSKQSVENMKYPKVIWSVHSLYSGDVTLEELKNAIPREVLEYDFEKFTSYDESAMDEAMSLLEEGDSGSKRKLRGKVGTKSEDQEWEGMIEDDDAKIDSMLEDDDDEEEEKEAAHFRHKK